MPGLWVFPGGKVEATDPGTVSLNRLGMPRRGVAGESGITLDPGAQPFSHWLTPVVVSRRFATWFFSVTLQAINLSKSTEVKLSSTRLAPSSAVALHHAGDLPMTPTLVSLHVIEQSADDASLSAAMQHRSVQRFFPNVVREDERMVFLYEGDAAYESGNLGDQGPVHRTTGERGIFHYHVAG